MPVDSRGLARCRAMAGHGGHAVRRLAGRVAEEVAARGRVLVVRGEQYPVGDLGLARSCLGFDHPAGRTVRPERARCPEKRIRSSLPGEGGNMTDRRTFLRGASVLMGHAALAQVLTAFAATPRKARFFTEPEIGALRALVDV